MISDIIFLVLLSIEKKRCSMVFFVGEELYLYDFYSLFLFEQKF